MQVDDLENDKHAYRADLARAARNEWRQMAVDILMRSPGPLPAKEIADRTATPIAPTVSRLRQWPAYFREITCTDAKGNRTAYAFDLHPHLAAHRQVQP